MNPTEKSGLRLTHSRPSALQHCVIGFGLFLTLLFASLACAQIENGDFEDSTNFWEPWGQGTGRSLSDDAYEGSGACLATDRTQYWNGLHQSLLDDLEVGKDYHFSAYVKLVEPGSRQLRFEIRQHDDGNDGQPQYTAIGDVVATDTEWTLLEGGFTLQANGPIVDLKLIINGTFLDPSPGPDEFDFLVDSVSVTENDWRAAADNRIEQFRKRDIVLGFVDQQSNPATNLEVDVQQIGHHFGFGSTLNDFALKTEPLYEDFFKQHFQWATIEWFSQWSATEVVRGIEDFSNVDYAVDFAQANGIQLKGHALTWPTPKFLPGWLLDLGPAEVQTELDERITDAATRYDGKLFGWDVSNETLDHDWLSDMLGPLTHSSMFQLARQMAPEAVLFTNETHLMTSRIRAIRYGELVEGLVADGADVGGIGLQSHFWGGFVSPKAMEIAISELDDFGIDLWFTEFDVESPNPEVRADCLEDFYRYAFSCPEVCGITMWGFWAGAHWRGADAALVDLDWTINAQGQRYLDLMDEWTTELESNSGGEGEVQFRGFNGNYLVTTVDPVTAITNYHLIVAEPGTNPLSVALVTNSSDGSLSIYGTPENDLFEFDLNATDRVNINGKTVLFNLPLPPSTVRFVGLDGEDRIETLSKWQNQHFKIHEDFMRVVETEFRVEYDQIESAYFCSRRYGSTVTFVDSDGDDTLTSYHEKSTLETPEIELVADNFRFLFCRSTAGNDTAWLHDTPGIDRMYTDLDIVSLRWGSRNRRVWDFNQVNVVSTLASDVATVDLPLGAKTISVSPSLTSIEFNGKQINLIGISRSTINGTVGNSDSVSFSGDDANQILRVSENSLRYSSPGFWSLIKNINQSTHPTDSAGFDRVVFTDTTGDDSFTVDQDTATLTSTTISHSWMYLDNIRATSSSGGTDTATLTNPTGVIVLIGDW